MEGTEGRDVVREGRVVAACDERAKEIRLARIEKENDERRMKCGEKARRTGENES